MSAPATPVVDIAFYRVANSTVPILQNNYQQLFNKIQESRRFEGYKSP